MQSLNALNEKLVGLGGVASLHESGNTAAKSDTVDSVFYHDVACIASVSVGLRSKERPRNGTGTVFCPREIGARAKIRKR